VVIYIGDDPDEPVEYKICECDEDVHDVIRKFGDEAIIGIIQGTILKDATDEVFENRPMGFLIEL